MSYEMATIGGDFIVCSSGKSYPNYRFQPERMTPVFGAGESGLMNKKGEWILPMTDQKIGYWGKGLFWTCKGAKIKKYCTEPHHVEGGLYGFANENGMLIDSLDDIALGFVNGVAPVLRNGKAALLDTTGKLITGFIYDKVVWQKRYFDDERLGIEDVRLWKLAVRTEGKWYAIQELGRTQLLDWPSDLKVEMRNIGWRKAYSDWIVSTRTAHIPCPIDVRLHRRPMYISRDLSYIESFPSEELLARKCAELREETFGKLDLALLEKDSTRALADKNGNLLTAWSQDEYDVSKDGLVMVKRIYYPDQKSSESESEFDESDGWDDFDTWDDRPVTLLGLLSPTGKVILPPDFEEIRVYPKVNLIKGDNGISDLLFTMEGKLIETAEGGTILGRVREDCFVYRTDSFNTILSKNHQVLARDPRLIDDVFIEGNWLWYTAGHSSNYYGKQLDGDSLIGPMLASQSPREVYTYMQRNPQFVCDSCAVDLLDNGHWKIFRGEEQGIADDKGHLILPVGDWKIYTRTGFYLIVKDDLEGLTDLQGKVILPIEYSDILILNKRFFKVRRMQDGVKQMAVIDRKGKVLWDWTKE